MKHDVAKVWKQPEQDQGSPDSCSWGVPFFDNLECSEKVVLLASVASALLRDEVDPMPLTGVNEAAVGVLFEHIRQSILVEIDCQHDNANYLLRVWRRLALARIGREELDEDEPMPKETCDDPNDWEWMVEAVASGILWDIDWLDGKFYMDVDRETAAM